MSYRLEAFSSVGLDEALISLVIDEHTAGRVPRLEKLWAYFRNPLEPVGRGLTNAPTYRPAQQKGLPARLIGDQDAALDDRTRNAREVVIENDIGWRLETMVDFMFGKPLQILSTADDQNTRRTIERLLDAVWETSGGIGLLQDIALLAHVYGYVDLIIRIDEHALRGVRTLDDDTGASIAAIAGAVRIEVVEPTRGIPLVSPDDYRNLDAYIVHFEREINEVTHRPPRKRSVLGRNRVSTGGPTRRIATVTEIFGKGVWQRYHDEELVAESISRWLPDTVPVIHIQNLAQPFRYEGVSEVEPLIPLQDELNTRLSDRANRVTMQSFKMYLARGLDGFDRVPVGPGQIWSTDNPDASIESFGGDTDSPGESAHIDEIREALDKISGVPPLAGGVVRAKIGNLSSANALKITLMGILAKTARKRVTYGRGMQRVHEILLQALDAAGILRTNQSDRGTRLIWPDPLPAEASEEAATAKTKLELGVPSERVLSELGYAPTDPGIA